MAETTADVRRDIELTRNRITDTLQELEHKMNVTQLIRDNPWPALALAVGAGVLLSGSRADVKAAAATLTATKGASGRLGSVLDELVSQVVHGFHGVVEQRIEGLANEVKRAIGAPLANAGRTTNHKGTMGSGAMGGNNPAIGMTGAGDGTSANSGAPRAD